MGEVAFICRSSDAVHLANIKPTPKLFDITLLIFCILLKLLLPQLPFSALKELSHDLSCLRMLFGALESFECSEIPCTGVLEWRDGQPWEIRRSLRRVGVWVYVWFGSCCVGGDLRDCCHCCCALLLYVAKDLRHIYILDARQRNSTKLSSDLHRPPGYLRLIGYLRNTR